MTQASPHDTRPVDREYLDLRLSEFESRVGADLARLESRLDHRLVSVLIGFMAPMMIAVIATLIAVIVK